MLRSFNHRLSRRGLLALGSAAMLLGTAARAAQLPINTLKNSILGGRTDTAINGYDTVAYFTVGKPVPGRDNWVPRRPTWICSRPTPRNTHRSTVATARTAWPRARWSR